MKQIYPLGAVTAITAAMLIAFAPVQAAVPAKAAVAHGSNASQAGKQLDVLASQYYDALARFEPVNATESGDGRFDDQIGMAIAPAMRARQFALYRSYQQRLHAIARASLNAKGQINYDILDYELASQRSFESIPEHLLPINQMDSMPVTLANYAGGQAAQSLTTVKGYKAYLNRLNQLPAWIDQAIANMREGMKQGITMPKAAMLSSLPLFQKLVSATPEASIFYTPISNFPSAFSAADKKSLTAAYRATIETKLSPALARLATFLEKEYIPAARTSTGWSALPGGKDW